jgi:hypothetical protein
MVKRVATILPVATVYRGMHMGQLADYLLRKSGRRRLIKTSGFSLNNMQIF